MGINQAINALFRNYEFTKDETEIIGFLSQDKATAETILKNTTVSNGRIYRVLASLEKTGIINKNGTKPSVYSMEPLKECINKFLDYKLKISTESQVEVLEAVSAMDGAATAEMLYGSKKSFDMEIIRMNHSCRWLKLIHKEDGIPWFLYAYFNDDEFFKIRGHMEKHRITGSSSQKLDLLQKRSSYLAMYAKKSVAHVMHPSALDNYKIVLKDLFEDNSSSYFEIINKEISHRPNVKIYVSESLKTPFSFYVYDKEVLLPIFTRKDQSRLLRIAGNDFIDVYSEYFDSFISGAHLFKGFDII